MERRFLVPAVTMLFALIVWVLFLVSHETSLAAMDGGVGIAVCGLVVIFVVLSAVSCRRVRGPRYGSLVRMGFLLLMAGVTYWRVDLTAASLFVAASVVTGILYALGELPAPEGARDGSTMATGDGPG